MRTERNVSARNRDPLPADAGLTDSYPGAVPADLILISGPFAHLSVDDLERTIGALDQLCATSATVVWSTYGSAMNVLDVVQNAFTTAGFSKTAEVADPDGEYLVAAHRFDGSPTDLFTFIA